MASLPCKKSAWGKEWVREPRLPLAGKEREEILAVIHRGIANRPKLPKS